MSIDLKTIALTNFAERHFDPTFAGTKIKTETPTSFIAKLLAQSSITLDGFAPFCKVLVVRNYTKCMSGMARITDENKDKLNGAWKIRREGEPEYWATWFNADDVNPKEAKYLHLILYSKDQLSAEGIELPHGIEWGIVSINAEQVPHEIPMHPETMRRNTAGIEAGGNGHQHTATEIGGQQ